MLTKSIGFLLLLAAMYCAWKFADPTSRGFHPKTSHEVSLADYINQDLKNLKAENALPTQWNSIQTIEYRLTDKQLKLLGSQRLQILENPKGTIALELQFIDLPDDQNPALILQMSLTDNSTHNKIWEMGRTYPIKKFLPPEQQAPK